MKYRSAYVTITAQVFIPEDEIADQLGIKDTDDATPVEQLPNYHPERIQIAFQDLANDKIHDLFPADDPLKLREVSIDLTTFQ